MLKPIDQLIIQFDSSAALLKSLALYHRHKDFEKGGLVPELPPWAVPLVNRIPRFLRRRLYSWSGWIDALQSRDIAQIHPEHIAQWATHLYPSACFRGIFFGSSNGAAIHLAAALGMPWLPQTYLLAVRRLVKPDQIHKDIAWGEKTITPFLNRFPQIHAAQMHDPVQDRLMVSKMGYFRLKFLSLPQEFKTFISKNIGPDQPLISVECTYPWPSLKVAKRHTFQLGGFGAIDPYEYLAGSDRTREFLEKIKAPVSHWETFKPSGEMPEAEWGYYMQPNEDLVKLAKSKKAPFYRFIFDHPEGLSDFTCDLYQWWYEKRLKFQSKRILIENFALVAPHRAVISGTLPFWLAFNTENSAQGLEMYLERKNRFEEIYLLLMSNGVTEGIGLATINQWTSILKHATNKGAFIGVDQREYPLDFATFLRYQEELVTSLPEQNKVPEPLSIQEVKGFLAQSSHCYSLKLKEETI